jgi:hypothetical protein
LIVLSDRRSLDVLRRLAKHAGTEVMIGAGQVDDAGRLSPIPAEFSDAQRAVVIAEAGWLAVQMAIPVACDPVHTRDRKSRRVWKATTPDTGAAAAVFMAHGLGETIRQQAYGETFRRHGARQEEARELLRGHFLWSEVDEREVLAAASAAGPPNDDPAAAHFEVTWGALRRLVGDEMTSSLPLITALRAGSRDADTYVAGVSWSVVSAHLARPYIALTDPELAARLTEDAGARSG